MSELTGSLFRESFEFQWVVIGHSSVPAIEYCYTSHAINSILGTNVSILRAGLFVCPEYIPNLEDVRQFIFTEPSVNYASEG